MNTGGLATLLLAALVLSDCDNGPASPTPTQSPAAGSPVRVLMLTATAGFRHDAIDTARQVMTTLAAATREFTVTATEDLSAINAAALTNVDVLFFALTSGELNFSDDQKRAIAAFVDGGGGFLGVHSATDTLYSWPDYGRIVGAYFKEHPWTQQATVAVEDGSHPATTGLPARFGILEEFYTFRENPRPRVQVLLTLDAASVNASGDYPLAWAHSVGAGRAYYNALGHFPATWQDARFQQQLRGAIRWVGQARPRGRRRRRRGHAAARGSSERAEAGE